jgi:hypothetical protein
VAPPSSIAAYVDLSRVLMLSYPAGRWHEIDEVVRAYEPHVGFATARIVWLQVAGGMALRRGDLQAAGVWLEELQSTALATGEPQRIVPMICVAVPWLVLSGKSDELRSLMADASSALDGRWPSVQTAVPVVRALSAGREVTLLERTLDSMRQTPKQAHVAILRTSLITGEGLLALERGQADEAVELLRAAIDAEREGGFVYDAACLELDLARALEAQGRPDAASEARGRAASVLDVLGVVNAF